MSNEKILEKFKQLREANDRAKNTLFSDIQVIERLLRFCNNKPFSQIKEKDTMSFVEQFENPGTKVAYATKIMIFFKWYHNKYTYEEEMEKYNQKKRRDLPRKLGKGERHPNMEWFEFPKKAVLVKRGDVDVKQQLLTDDEYNKMQQYIARDIKWSALFETLYLSGGRPNEVNQMNVGDAMIDKDGTVTLVIRDSKTIPRKVPLPENPAKLKNWLSYHPFKDNKDSPLFPSNNHRNMHQRMATVAINRKFDVIKKYTGIKSTLTPHCFRKTRATIMFSSRDPIFDDTEIAQYFGWKSHTVVDRREQYDLRNFDDLKQKIQGNVGKIETYDTIKQERDTLEQELKMLREQVAKVTQAVDVMQGNVVWKEE